MVIPAASPISVGSSRCYLCHAEGIVYGTSPAVSRALRRFPFENGSFFEHSGTRCKNPFTGATQVHWSPVGREICLSKVSVAADYSDSVPDSSNFVNSHGYHPLEELKVCKRIRDTKLTPAEIARTTVEANSSALLMLPSAVHCEPHDHISWAEFLYVVDEYGDIFFEIFDDENILQDPGASNPVNVLIGMDIPTYENRRIATDEYNISNTRAGDDIPSYDDYFEVEDSELSYTSADWGMPMDSSSGVHPTYFTKCLAQAVTMEYAKLMDHPKNGVSVVGCLRPAFVDEDLYLRRLFSGEDNDGYTTDWKGGHVGEFRNEGDPGRTSSTIYKLEIMRIELFSVYGDQLEIDLHEFQEAEPDVLVHFTSAIVERFGEKGTRCSISLKALCKKKGLRVEGATLIGVDSLGMDVRVFSGVEVQTHRFPFKARAISEVSAEKQINQLLFPRARRKKNMSHHNDKLGDVDHF